jgi:hypothetical protein
MKLLRPFSYFASTLLFIAGSAEFAIAQGFQVSGTVTNSVDGTSLAGVSVQVKGTNIGFLTNMSGDYQIQARSAADTLVFTRLGSATVHVPITTVEGPITSSRNVINVCLQPQMSEPGRVFFMCPDTRPATVVVNRNSPPPPLYLIDGVIADSDTFNALSPEMIESVRLVRGDALAQFGDAGRNGVVEVTTKDNVQRAP